MRPANPRGTDDPALWPAPRPGSVAMALLILAAAMVLAILLFVAQFSGSLRWFLVVVFLGVVAAFAWRRIRAGSAEPSPLVRHEEPDAHRPGDLSRLSASLRRAVGRNLAYSQLVVTARARSAFVERVGLALAISPESLREVQGDRDAWFRLLGDRELVDFLSVRSEGLEEGVPWVRRAREGAGFRRAFRGLLDRMEAWR